MAYRRKKSKIVTTDPSNDFEKSIMDALQNSYQQSIRHAQKLRGYFHVDGISQLIAAAYGPAKELHPLIWLIIILVVVFIVKATLAGGHW